MNPHKLIRSGVANDPGNHRPTLQHCLEATLSIADPMIDELLERLALLVDPQSLVPTPVELKGVDLKGVAQWLDRVDAIKETWTTELRQVFYHGETRDVDVHVVVRFDDLRLLDDQQIDAALLEAGAEDVTMRLRGGPRLVKAHGGTFLLPTVVHCTSSQHPLANREFLFPFVSVVDVTADEMAAMPECIGSTLAVTALTNDESLRQRLVESDLIGRLNLGPLQTNRIAWDQPHEGNLFDHLYARRAFQKVG